MTTRKEGYVIRSACGTALLVFKMHKKLKITHAVCSAKELGIFMDFSGISMNEFRETEKAQVLSVISV